MLIIIYRNEVIPNFDNGMERAALDTLSGSSPAVIVFPKSWNNTGEILFVVVIMMMIMMMIVICSDNHDDDDDDRDCSDDEFDGDYRYCHNLYDHLSYPSNSHQLIYLPIHTI